MRNASEHYNKEYFDWQKNIGNFGGKAETFKFKANIKPEFTVLDFGCGGGYILANLKCKNKIGIEVNETAYEEIEANGVTPYKGAQQVLSQLGEESVDIIISNHALEHTLNPLKEINELYPLLKRGGLIHFFVPCDNINKKFHKNDINFHLYSWSPSNLGNLFTEAGYEVIMARPYFHKWPPKFYEIQKKLGWPIFNLICRVYARMERSWTQVEVMAIKR